MAGDIRIKMLSRFRPPFVVLEGKAREPVSKHLLGQTPLPVYRPAQRMNSSVGSTTAVSSTPRVPRETCQPEEGTIRPLSLLLAYCKFRLTQAEQAYFPAASTEALRWAMASIEIMGLTPEALGNEEPSI